MVQYDLYLTRNQNTPLIPPPPFLKQFVIQKFLPKVDISLYLSQKKCKRCALPTIIANMTVSSVVRVTERTVTMPKSCQYTVWLCIMISPQNISLNLMWHLLSHCAVDVSKLTFQFFTLTKLYIYHILATCFGPYLDHHQGIARNF